MKKIILAILILLALLPFAVKFISDTGKVLDTFNEGLVHSTLRINGTIVSVVVADTYEARRQGLSGISSIERNQGLLFAFTSSKHHGIWMKEMLFPIDIIWFDENLRVVDVKENASPDSYPETFYPRTPSRNILEVNAGFVDRYNIQIGDGAVFER